MVCFLLITPADRPGVQLALLRQVARLASSETARNELMQTRSPAELMDWMQRFLQKSSATCQPSDPGYTLSGK
jgi:mannitol/fructose-specific phosphotransferase system IIA component (Ntr-type)